jgi:hypothetical protein
MPKAMTLRIIFTVVCQAAAFFFFSDTHRVDGVTGAWRSHHCLPANREGLVSTRLGYESLYAHQPVMMI